MSASLENLIRRLCTLYSALSTARVSTAVLQTILQMLTARTPTITDKVQAGAPGSSSSSSGSTTSGSSSSSGGSGSGTQSNLLNMLTYAADIINAISPDAAATTPAPPIVNRSDKNCFKHSYRFLTGFCVPHDANEGGRIS